MFPRFSAQTIRYINAKFFDFPLLALFFIISSSIAALAAFLITPRQLLNDANTSELSEFLFNKTIDSLSASELWNIREHLFSLWLPTIALPLFIAALVTRFVLDGFRNEIQRAVAIGLSFLFLLFSYGAFVTESPQVAQLNLLNKFLALAPGSFYQTLRVFLLVLVVIAFLTATARERIWPALRVIGLLAIVGGSIGWLLLDWQHFHQKRVLIHQSLHARPTSTLVLFAEGLSRAQLEKLTGPSGSILLKERTATIFNVVPASRSTLAQFTTALSGLDPWQHGIRTSIPSPNNSASFFETAITQLHQSFSLVHMTNLGSLDPVSQFMRYSDTGTHCLATASNLSLSLLARMQALPLSILPSNLGKKLFPEQFCSTQIWSLPALVQEEFLTLAEHINAPQRLLSIWWLARGSRNSSNVIPVPNSQEWEPTGNDSQVAHFDEVLWVLANHLQAFDLVDHFNIAIIGINAEQQASSFAAWFPPPGRTMPSEKTKIPTTIPNKAIFSLLANERLGPNIEPAYSEEIILPRNHIAIKLFENQNTSERTMRRPEVSFGLLKELVFHASRKVSCSEMVDQQRVTCEARLSFNPDEAPNYQPLDCSKLLTESPLIDGTISCRALLPQQLQRTISEDLTLAGSSSIFQLQLQPTIRVGEENSTPAPQKEQLQP